MIVDYELSSSRLTFAKEDNGALVGSAETLAEAVAVATPRGRASGAKALAKRASASKGRSVSNSFAPGVSKSDGPL